MCCLFGLIDPQLRFTGKQKSRMLHALASAAEARGTDASGIAFHTEGRLVIRKAPVPGHRLKTYVPGKVTAVMGHTRMTTQGDARKVRNNHPFRGNTPLGAFAAAHNGVLYNDRLLRESMHLPDTRIETDSYAAVQLIEQKKALDFSSLKYMAETVEGSFTFTFLDTEDAIYIVKGDSPFFLLHWPRTGLYLYASTEDILRSAVRQMPISLQGAARIGIVSGEILRIDRRGNITRSSFDDSGLFRWHSPYAFDPCGCLPGAPKCDNYIGELKSVACAFGYTPEMIDRLIAQGYQPEEIEEFLYEI